MPSNIDAIRSDKKKLKLKKLEGRKNVYVINIFK